MTTRSALSALAGALLLFGCGFSSSSSSESRKCSAKATLDGCEERCTHNGRSTASVCRAGATGFTCECQVDAEAPTSCTVAGSTCKSCCGF